MYATRLALQNAMIAETVTTGDSGFSALCAEFITRAEKRMFTGLRPLRVREMEIRTTLTITAGVGATPSGFLEARRLTWVAAVPYKLIYRQPEDFYDMTGAYSRATIYTIDGTVINVLAPDSGTATLSYYATPTALSADNSTHSTLTAHGHVYLAAALMEAYQYLDDPSKVAKWEQRFVEAIEGANLAAAKARYSGTILAPRVPGALAYARARTGN